MNSNICYVILFALVYCLMLVCNRKYCDHLKSDFANRSQYLTLIEFWKTWTLRLPSNLTIPVGELMSHLIDLLTGLLVKIDGLTSPKTEIVKLLGSLSLRLGVSESFQIVPMCISLVFFKNFWWNSVSFHWILFYFYVWTL